MAMLKEMILQSRHAQVSAADRENPDAHDAAVADALRATFKVSWDASLRATQRVRLQGVDV